MNLTPSSYSNMTAEQELSIRIPGEVLPKTEDIFSEILSIQQMWIVNGMEAKIAAALANGNQRIEGILASDWYSFGEALRLLLAFVNEPQESLMDRSILQVVLKRYKREI